MHRLILLLTIPLVAPALSAQRITVDYPDSVINSPQGQYPVFTPTNGNTVRGQIYCPSTFAGLPATKMVCTHVGIQIAGKLPYDQFVGRAGISPVPALTTTFATNLPDQRVQFDLSGQNLPGGGTGTTASTQINIWVEFPLCHPFIYTPGNNLVVDITSKSQVAGQYCRTAIGTGVTRMLNLAYTPTSTTGSVSGSGGIKLRFVFEPLYAPIEFGAGCAGTNQAVPKLTGTGSTQLGQSNVLRVDLSNARPNSVGILVLGLSCLDVPVFGGCHIYPSLDLFVPGLTSNAGTIGSVFVVPNDASLDGVAVALQYAVDDPNSAANPLTFSLSNGLRLALFK